MERLKRFLSNKFLPYKVIRGWHKIKMFPDFNEVFISEYED